MVPTTDENENMEGGSGRGRGKYNRKRADVDGSVDDGDIDGDDDNGDISLRKSGFGGGRKYNFPLSTSNDFSPRPNARVSPP